VNTAQPITLLGVLTVLKIAAPTGFTGPFSGAGGLLNSIFPGACTVWQRQRASRQSHKSTGTPDWQRIRRRDPWVLLERGLHVQQVCFISHLIQGMPSAQGKTPDIGGCLCTYMNMVYLISWSKSKFFTSMYVYEFLVFDIVPDIKEKTSI
jgi:hypothetical protein